MDMVELDRRAQEHMLQVKERGRERGYRYHHGVRVSRIAATLAREAGVAGAVDHEVLEAAARLHDIAKDGVTTDHAREGAQLVATQFADLLGDRTEAVRSAVFEHNKRGQPELPAEAKLVQDADILDHLGAMDIWLAYQWQSGEASLEETISYFGSDCQQRWRSYLLTHLNYPIAKEAALRRLETTAAYLAALRREIAGELW